MYLLQLLPVDGCFYPWPDPLSLQTKWTVTVGSKFSMVTDRDMADCARDSNGAQPYIWCFAMAINFFVKPTYCNANHMMFEDCAWAIP